ncbi:shikimate kinase [Rhodococcus sp. BP-149]|nr:shikimate kinase [Rhodococcus sp. BP-288]MBY6693887.1 shikimate kinase [Rhodococcus sp. BP-188]MBY6699172.1 shikimate kinase [Rhodococcus sp. BP-285]MBY6702780.1 shikimate kinase [Rhodococcus sp. BP-283]MBY6705432.1 shikimate kinase [Rhodococcus sp. BP-241]MBY6711640.1 shikimate kinase [Rhodococcus sp. BP-160]MBY6715310.1 shikimate kinase [Rhodococcus sp. BP-110]MBY6719242.1 shikimate kinase [Rhodococcus sp. BP-142]MBY6725360.1 shikimate kinase [Rhodococcus sp. BP-149]MBY6727568.1 shiki
MTGQAGGRSQDAGQAGGRSGETGEAGEVSGPPRAVLIGPPGAGKSTIGRRLAQALGTQVYDTDVAIEKDTGRTIPQIFAESGEAEFRAIEERIVLDALRTYPGIVSLGGGAILSSRTRAALRGHTVVYLEISVGEGLRRTGATTANASRPLLAGSDPRAKYRELMRTRRPLYREVSTIRVRTDGRSPARVVTAVLGRLGVAPADRVPAPAAPPQRTSPRRRIRRKGGRPIPTDPGPLPRQSAPRTGRTRPPQDPPPAQETLS